MSRSRTLPSFSSSRQMMMRLEGERAFAQAGDHHLAAGLDALGDGDFALARQQLDRAHLAQIHAHRIVGAVGGFGVRVATAFGGRPRRARRLRLVFLGRRSSASASSGLFALDDVDAHLVEHRMMSSICSEETSSDGRTAFSSS